MNRFQRIAVGMGLACAAAFSATAQDSRPVAYMVSNAHFDTQWNWDVQRSIREYIPRTMERNLMLLDRYPEYVFNFEGGIKYSWMKEYYPQLFEAVRLRVREGRWHVSGSSWDATDPNMPSGESFTRNILYGQRFYREEFGVESTDIFLPDCFGFGWTLPSYAAHSGLIGFSTQKLQWRYLPFHGDSKVPFGIGLWQGIDGSRIMMAPNARSYTSTYNDEDLSRRPDMLDKAAQNVNNVLYHYYGVGDRGGSPTIASVQSVVKGVHSDGPVRIISAESDRLFKDYLPYDAHQELPVWDGELLMDTHATGCYTSQAAMKYYNRRNELMADAAERSSVVADWLGGCAYPHAELTEGWKRFLWHQFHDDLTGTSIPRAYEFSWNDELITMKQFAGLLTSSVAAVSAELDTYVKGIPAVVYNPAAFPVDGLVEIAAPEGYGAVYDAEGRRIPSQRSGDVLLVSVSVPALGYAVLDLRKGSPSAASRTLKAGQGTLENSIYRISLDGRGDISSIVDKRCGRELVKAGSSIGFDLFTQNDSFSWPAWEILKKTIDMTPEKVEGNVRISVHELGPVRATLCVERTWGESAFRQYVSLTEDGAADRIDVRCEIDWAGSGCLLKAAFPLSVSNPTADYDLSLGHIARGSNVPTAYEVYAHQWADLSDADGSYGVSIYNDSKYGWDKPDDSTIRLTLLHTPNTARGYRYQSSQDFGHHMFTYSISGHQGPCDPARAVAGAEVLNRGLSAFFVPRHRGRLGRSFSFVQVEDPNVSLKALKRAEDDADTYVVRFYENSGTSSRETRAVFAGDILEAKELNGNEDVIGEASFSGRSLNVGIGAFGMKTYSVRLRRAGTSSPVKSVPVDIPYNFASASFNAFRGLGNLDGQGRSLPAELIPDTLIYQGVAYRMGDPARKNVLKAAGAVLRLPDGQFDKVCLLAASIDRDRICEFRAGDKVQHALVPCWNGFVGQWGHTGHTEGFLKPADIAFAATHLHDARTESDIPYEFGHMFRIELDVPDGVKEITLPESRRIVIFAATAVQTGNAVASPACDMLRVGLPAPEAINDWEDPGNLLFGRPIAGRSGEANRSERAENAIDDNVNTKWCDVSDAAPKFIAVDLGEVTKIGSWHVLHAGDESSEYITRDFSLQVSDSPEGAWRTVDSVTGNSANMTDRTLPEPVEARYVRLNVTVPAHHGTAARIYEFSVGKAR